MELLIFAIILFISNALGVYFTFKTWYGKESVGEVPVILDEDGNLRIDEEEMKKDANN
jgi:hypothetical protein